MSPANSINNKSRGGKQKIQTRLACNLIEAESPVVLFSRLLVIIDKYVPVVLYQMLAKLDFIVVL